jgi:hypothetical protein
MKVRSKVIRRNYDPDQARRVKNAKRNHMRRHWEPIIAELNRTLQESIYAH